MIIFGLGRCHLILQPPGAPPLKKNGTFQPCCVKRDPFLVDQGGRAPHPPPPVVFILLCWWSELEPVTHLSKSGDRNTISVSLWPSQSTTWHWGAGCRPPGPPEEHLALGGWLQASWPPQTCQSISDGIVRVWKLVYGCEVRATRAHEFSLFRESGSRDEKLFMRKHTSCNICVKCESQT